MTYRNRLPREKHPPRQPKQPSAPAAPPPAAPMAAFCPCPLPVFQGFSPQEMFMIQALYQAAWEEARAVARPSILERDLLGVWN